MLGLVDAVGEAQTVGGGISSCGGISGAVSQSVKVLIAEEAGLTGDRDWLKVVEAVVRFCVKKGR